MICKSILILNKKFKNKTPINFFNPWYCILVTIAQYEDCAFPNYLKKQLEFEGFKIEQLGVMGAK